MTVKPKQQGNLDGLCGIYAIVNALGLQGLKDADSIFQTCCSALVESRWPAVLWKGTTLRDLEVMLKSCREEFAMDHISVRYPFHREQPASNEEFWTEFDELFAEKPKTTCAIIGLEAPYLHWLVAKRKGKDLIFIDSDSIHPRRTVSRSDIYAGGRRTNDETYRLNRKEVVLFEKRA